MTASSAGKEAASNRGRFTHPGHHKGQLGRAEHGEFTVHTKTGDKTLDTQRGVVTAVNTGSVTVKSTDGFTATYTLTPKVHKGKQTATTTQITTNDRVRVLATKTGTTATATHIWSAPRFSDSGYNRST